MSASDKQQTYGLKGKVISSFLCMNIDKYLDSIPKRSLIGAKEKGMEKKLLEDTLSDGCMSYDVELV